MIVDLNKINFSFKIGGDVNPYLISLLQYVQNENNKLPFEITEDEYNRVKDNKDSYPEWYVGLVGFCATFGAKWFGGYARGFKADKTTPRNLSNEAIRNIEKQRISLKGIEFIPESYEYFTKTKDSLIYCDIPYRGTTKYGNQQFDYGKFYDWCEIVSKNNNTVLISEYWMPEDRFDCIWKKEHSTSVSKDVNKHSKRVEKLFILK